MSGSWQYGLEDDQITNAIASYTEGCKFEKIGGIEFLFDHCVNAIASGALNFGLGMGEWPRRIQTGDL